jgi:two-component system OmpR family response regulator
MTKPFELRELQARLRALVRRDPVQRPTVLEVGGLRLDPAARTVARDGVAIELAEKPFALLEAFMRRPGMTLTRLVLLDAAWDLAYENRSNVVDQQVRLLRDRIDRPFGVESLETVRGRGYRLRQDGGR